MNNGIDEYLNHRPTLFLSFCIEFSSTYLQPHLPRDFFTSIVLILRHLPSAHLPPANTLVFARKRENPLEEAGMQIHGNEIRNVSVGAAASEA